MLVSAQLVQLARPPPKSTGPWVQPVVTSPPLLSQATAYPMAVEPEPPMSLAHEFTPAGEYFAKKMSSFPTSLRVVVPMVMLPSKSPTMAVLPLPSVATPFTEAMPYEPANTLLHW